MGVVKYALLIALVAFSYSRLNGQNEGTTVIDFNINSESAFPTAWLVAEMRAEDARQKIPIVGMIKSYFTRNYSSAFSTTR